MTVTTEWQDSSTDALFQAVLALRTRDEAAGFFRDLCTLRELEEMSHRWAIVQMLDTGVPYREIAEETGASTATVTRINHWLQHGTGGYRMVLDRLARRRR